MAQFRVSTWLSVLLCGHVVIAAAEERAPVSELQTFGTMGKELKVLEPDKEFELFKHDGRGCLTHMWFGGNWPGYDRTRIRVYVDGEKTSSISMEMFMGHGIGYGDDAAPWGIARMGKTGHPSGIYNTYRIPFGTKVRVTAQLGEGVDERPPFWWIVRGVENLPIEIGGVELPATARLKLYTREHLTVKALEEFDLFSTSKAGAVYQVVMCAHSENFCYLEACMRAYFSGATEPTFLSSGLEDYFLGTYYFNRGTYYTPVAGLTHIREADHSFSAYRFHDDDPIFFQKGLRLTCRCGERIGDQTFWDPKDTTYSTYAWVYEW